MRHGDPDPDRPAAERWIASPKACIAEAERSELPIQLAAALLEKESGGHNVFGHDRDRAARYIFPARDGTVKVTKELYLEYKRRRVASGNKAMQGVGPCQPTWSFQDDADKLGGCWKPQVNMRVGFQRLASPCARTGLGRRAHVQRQRRRRGRVQR